MAGWVGMGLSGWVGGWRGGSVWVLVNRREQYVTHPTSLSCLEQCVYLRFISSPERAPVSLPVDNRDVTGDDGN